MATTILGLFTLPSSSSSSITAQTTRLPAVAPPVSARCSLPEFAGLKKTHHSASNQLLASLSSRKSLVVRNRRGGGGSIVCEAPKTSIEVASVTDKTWESLVLKADRPVLVEFWAPWCGPCRMLLPTIGELSQEYAGKLECYKLNTDDCPSIATQFGIRSIPTIMIFVNGEKKDAVIGAVPKTTLTACIEKFL